MSVKPFSEHGHYTAVHDAVFDVVMPFCPPNAFKVLLFVLRKTRGWKKDEDVLRYAEIKAGTGIKSDATLAKELDWLIRKKLLNARDEGGGRHRKGSRKAPAYSLNRDFELKAKAKAMPDATTSENEVSTTSENEASNNHPSQEPSVEANASSGIAKAPPQSVGLEKYIVDNIYQAMREANLRLPNEHFKYHLGRAKDVLEKDDPTDAEIEALPAAFVDFWTIKGKADAHLALMEYRRQKRRPDLVRAEAPSWEPINPHSPRPQTLSDDELARRRREREELGRQMAEARARDKAGMSNE